MKRITGRVVFTLLLTAPFGATPHAAAAVYTAASCNRSDVNAIINGPAHIAVNGDTIQIPSGSCTWTSGITVPSNIGIMITGMGTPNATAATTGASASCSNTTITITGAQAFRMTPTYGNSTTRLSCMKWTYGSGASIGFLIQGTCIASGCPNIRIDNVTFTNWAGHAFNGIGYGINVLGDVFGAIDHNTIDGVTGNYLQLVEFSHAKYLGTGLFGDNAWAQSESYGSANFLFIENNQFDTAGCCENEAAIDSQENQGGGRVVVRFNQFANMDNLNFSMGWHGTESNGRPRSARAFEYYGNTYICDVHCDSVAGARGGTGLVWGNTIDLSAGSLNGFFTINNYRTEGNPSNPWGACDGSSPYDTNDGTTYFSGSVGSGGGTTTITVSGGSPGWTTNQWAPNGAPYSVHDITQNTGTEITANTANTLTLSHSGGPGNWLPRNGDLIQILRATRCIDQSGSRGAGILFTGSTPTPASSANEVLSPTYIWSNTFSGGTPGSSSPSGTSSNTARVIRSRDFYVENTNQAAQTNATSPFNGTTTIGIGHGTLANRPTTCTVGVGYWATDQGTWNRSGSGGQGQLYLCTATNTWTAWYMPYTYPHPLISGSASVLPTAPTNLRIISQL